MTTFDPADTLSGILPSLPPVPRDDGGELTVLDRRFPIRVGGEISPHFDALIRGAIRGGWDPKFLQDETSRAAVQAAGAAAAAEERFIKPLHVTVPIPAIPAAIPPIVYHELGEAALEDDWETGPGTAILAAAEAPRRHSHRGRGGRFAREAS